MSDVRDAAQHFERFASRDLGEAGRIGRLLPNINVPDTKVSRLYANLIVSVSLWAALGVSVWADHIERKETVVKATRVIRVYRKIPGATALILASMILAISVITTVFRTVQEHRAFGRVLTKSEIGAWRLREQINAQNA